LSKSSSKGLDIDDKNLNWKTSDGKSRLKDERRNKESSGVKLVEVQEWEDWKKDYKGL
jgi:hypothetical protein